MLDFKNLTENEFNIIWDMFCSYKYCSISKEELSSLKMMKNNLETEGKNRGILDNW